METRIFALALMGFNDGSPPSRTSDQQGAADDCACSFRAFLPYWQFKDRETGHVRNFSELWPGQAQFAELMETEAWLFALKAGKLGFTELECAFDAWVALFRQPNARVHLFSRDTRAAQDLLVIVKFGLTHLPEWLALPIISDVPGGDTVESLKLFAGPDDIRSIVSYSAGPNVAIDQTATHSHVDELARMPFPERTWSAIETTVAPAGTCHVVTRGAGDANFTAILWEAAVSRVSRLFPFFAPWHMRPDRDGAWRELEGGSLAMQQLLHFAPETAEDALAGDETAEYIPLVIWDLCKDESLPEIGPGDRTPLVVGVDGAVTGDYFAVVAVSRHPARHDEPAIRGCKVWRPQDTGGRINFQEPERFIRFLCEGGCALGHPKALPLPGCIECETGRFNVPSHHVVQVCYDRYQLEEMMQRLRRDRVAWCFDFPQGPERAVADSSLLRLALQRRLAHNGNADLREHVANARAKLSKDDDSRLRIIKKAPNRKVDLIVAVSMAVDRIMYLNL